MMKFSFGELWKWSVPLIPQLCVFGTLIGLGYWGHTQHWKIPKFSELMGSPRPADATSPQVSTGSHQRDAIAKAPDDPARPRKTEHSPTTGNRAHLPPIRFASPDAVRKAGITIGRTEERPIAEFVTANAVVGYDETRLAQLSCRVSGIVWRVDKKLGDPVKKGEILAIIDSSEVGKAKAEFLEADAGSDLAVKTLNRLTQAREAIPGQRLLEAESELRLAKVRRFNAQQKLSNLGLPVSIQELNDLSDVDLAEKLHFLGLPAELVSTLDQETASANLIPLTSPLDGVVIDREIVTGEVVAPDQKQFVIADVRRMWLILNVRREDSAALRLGQTVLFTAAGMPGKVESKIVWIATETDKRTRGVQVRAEVENPPLESPSAEFASENRLLRANMYGTGKIRVRQAPDALVVPSTAVQWDGTQHLIFSPEDDGTRFRAHPVEVGVIRDGFTEIRAGVLPDQPIVVTGSYLLKSELMGVDN